MSTGRALALSPLLLALVAVPPAFGEEDRRVAWGDRVEIFGEPIAIPTDQVVRGNVVAIGGSATVEGEVDGQVFVLGGTLSLGPESRVTGGVIGVFANLELGAGAEVEGDFVNVLGGLDDAGAVFSGGHFDLSPGLGRVPDLWQVLLWFKLSHKLLVFVLLVGLVALLPRRIALIADEAPVRYLTAVFVGLLGYLGFWALELIISFTVAGPVIGWLIFVTLKWMGLAGIFCALGRSIAGPFGRRLSPFAAVMLAFALYSLAFLAPAFLGWFGLMIGLALRVAFFLLFEAPAVGLVLMTRFGTRSEQRELSPAPAEPRTAPAT